MLSKASSGHLSSVYGKESVGTAEGGGGRERASATTFSAPGVCLMSEVNSAISDSWRSVWPARAA